MTNASARGDDWFGVLLDHNRRSPRSVKGCGQESESILENGGQMTREQILEVRGVSKSFPGVHALAGVDFELKRGEVHAIVGENGAGKSTLVLVLGGIHRADAGEIFIDGKKADIQNPLDSVRSGISVVFQELSLVPGLSVAENIFPNRQPVGRLRSR